MSGEFQFKALLKIEEYEVTGFPELFSQFKLDMSDTLDRALHSKAL